MRRAALALAAAVLLVGPAAAVGLGPLVKDGVIDGPDEAFYLTVANPYEGAADFVAYPVGHSDEEPQGQVDIFPSEVRLASGSSRQILVIAHGLQVDSIYKFRVCAQRKTPPEGIAINARVCSKLSARRIS